MAIKILSIILMNRCYITLLFFGISYTLAQEIPDSIPYIEIDKDQLPKQPINVAVNVLNKNSNLGFEGTSSCLCTFYFDSRLRDCLMQLANEKLNEELKLYQDNRLKHVWGMLNNKQKIHVLTAVDETMYQRMTPFDRDLPKTKIEFLKQREQQSPQTWTMRCVAATIAAGAYYAIRSTLSRN